MTFRGSMLFVLAVPGILALAAPSPASPPPAGAEIEVIGYHGGSMDTARSTIWRANVLDFLTVGSANPGATSDWHLLGQSLPAPSYDSGFADDAWTVSFGASISYFLVGGEIGDGAGGRFGHLRLYDNTGLATGLGDTWNPMSNATSGVYASGFMEFSGKAWWIVGGSWALSSSVSQAFIQKYADNMNPKGSTAAGGTIGVDAVRHMVTENTGTPRIWAVGHRYMAGEGANWLVMHIDASTMAPVAMPFSPNGYNSPGSGDDFARAIARYGTDIYIAGSEARADLGTGRDWRIQKWRDDFFSTEYWTVTSNGGADGDDEAMGIGVLSDGTVVVAGYVDRSEVGEGKNWVVRRYDNDGFFQGETEYDSPSHGDDAALSVLVTGTLFVVTGYEDRSDIGQGRNWRRVTCGLPGSLPYLDVVARVSDTDPGVSDTVTVALTVTAVGGAFTGVEPGLRFYNGSAQVTGGPTPSSVGTLSAGTSQTFVWTMNVTSAGQVGLTASASGTDSGSGARQTVRAHAEAGSLSARVEMPSVLVRGQVVSVTVFAANAGLAKFTAQAPKISVVSPGSTLMEMGGPFPAGPVTLAPGGQQGFVWTFTVSGAGAATLSVTVSGTCSSPLTPHLRALAISATTVQAAGLSMTLTQTGGALSSTVVVTGQWFRISCTVWNPGNEAVSTLTPAIQWNSGAGLVSVISAPVPLAALGGNSGTVFAWTVSASGAGSASWTVTVSGAASVTGAGLAQYASAGAAIVGPGRLSATVTLEEINILKGKPFLVVLTVSNTGVAPVTSVTALPVQFTRGLGGTEAGPVPAVVAALAAGETVSFSYTCSAISVGVVTVSPSVTGIESVSGAAVTAAASGNLISLAKAEFSAQLFVSPSPALLADRITVTYRVTNVGQYPAFAVVPAITVLSGGSLLQPLSGAGGVGGTLNPETTRDYVWTYRVAGSGSASFLASVSGQDQATLELIDDSHLPVAQRSAGVSITRLEDTNLPDPGTFHIRNGAIRIKDKAVATIVLRGKGGEGEVELFVYSRAGLPLGRIGTGAVPLSAAGLAIVPFDGTIDGKALATGMYWIIARGAITTRQRVVVVNE